jgi:hypothetical protein
MLGKLFSGVERSDKNTTAGAEARTGLSEPQAIGAVK